MNQSIKRALPSKDKMHLSFVFVSSLQQGLQDSNSKCQALEENNLSLRHTLSDMEYKLKEMEYYKCNLEQENKNLRFQVLKVCFKYVLLL